MYIYQTMSNSFGYLDIILLGMIAGFIILRLRSILGRKTGHESKVYPNFAEKKFSMPQNDIKPQEKNLEILEGKDKKEFLQGAEIAYESILTAFANDDLIKLKSLLAPNMLSNFSDAIVVGSAIVNEINSLKIKNLDNDLIVKNMIDFLLALSHPLKS